MSSRCVLPIAWATLALAGCAATVTPVVAVPGPNKDLAVFQRDETACRTAAAEAAVPAGDAANTSARWSRYFAAYAQCAASHGDAVQPVPWAAAGVGFNDPAVPYGYGYGYGYAYPYTYGYPIAFGYPYGFYPGIGYGLGYGYGFGYGFYGRFGYGGYRGFSGGGFHGGHGGYGGFHGGGTGFHH